MSEANVIDSAAPPCPCAGTPAPEPRLFAFRFTGSGAEYFRIWVVNLLLSLATLGVYSAWAKVRRLQYFDRNTMLAGASFDFHGEPRVILRGRLLAVALLAAYQYAVGFSVLTALLVGLLFLLAAPLLMRGALRFRLANTSYRALRFAFTGQVGGAYRAYLAPAFLFVLPGALLTLAGNSPLDWLVVLLYVFWPALYARMKRYQYGHLCYGNQASSADLPLRAFYALYLAGALLFAAGLALGVGVFVASALLADPTSYEVGHLSTAMLVGWAILAYLMLGPYQQARVTNLCLERTRFPDVRFVSTLRTWPYVRLQAKNMALTLLSLGLYRPFAVVSAYRYRLEHLALASEGGLDQVLAHAVRPQGAAGDGAADFFGFDLSW